MNTDDLVRLITEGVREHDNTELDIIVLDSAYQEEHTIKDAGLVQDEAGNYVFAILTETGE